MLKYPTGYPKIHPFTKSNFNLLMSHDKERSDFYVKSDLRCF